MAIGRGSAEEFESRETRALAVVRRRAPGPGRRAACRRCAGSIRAADCALLACPLMMLITFATTRGRSASHPRTGHQPIPSRLRPARCRSIKKGAFDDVPRLGHGGLDDGHMGSWCCCYWLGSLWRLSRCHAEPGEAGPQRHPQQKSCSPNAMPAVRLTTTSTSSG